MKIALLACAGFVLAGCAAGQPQAAYSAADSSAMSDVVAVEAGSCFRMSQIRSHKKLDDSTLVVEVANKSVYLWEMGGRCLAGASSSDPLILEPAGGNDVICRPIDLSVKVKTGPVVSPCIVKSFKKLSPDEVAALPPKARP